MTTSRIVVLVPEFHAKSGRESELRGRLVRLAALSRREAGCLEYTLLEDPSDPARLSIFERWVDRDALDAHDAHDATSYVREFVASFDHLLEEPLAVRRLRLVE
jgi:quinol monooxygenase YgiN